MFASSTQIITLTQEIQILGLSLQKSGLPITFDSLGKLWDIYSRKYRGKMPDAQFPLVEYAVCINDIPDYITGCAVSQFHNIPEGFAAYVIPKGQYIQDTFCAENFEKLTEEELSKRDISAWAKENGVEIDGHFTIEVYPDLPDQDKNCYGMYTLTPVISKNR